MPCKWCGAPTRKNALPSDAAVDVCDGRFACPERKAMEEGAEQEDAAYARGRADERADVVAYLAALGYSLLAHDLATDRHVDAAKKEKP
jgi:hypothetical protein